MSPGRDTDGPYRESARALAKQITHVFRYHDENEREAAIEAMCVVDEAQFAHLSAEEADAAAEAYVDALWAKDALEAEYTADTGELDCEGLFEADWSPVESAFRRRADVAGIDERYADVSTVAWRNHKAGRGDYWTAFQQAQVYELRAALQDEEYPHKPRYGQSGFGPEAARYTVGVELHDMHTEEHWRQAVEVMTPYFERILRGHRE